MVARAVKQIYSIMCVGSRIYLLIGQIETSLMLFLIIWWYGLSDLKNPDLVGLFMKFIVWIGRAILIHILNRIMFTLHNLEMKEYDVPVICMIDRNVNPLEAAGACMDPWFCVYIICNRKRKHVPLLSLTIWLSFHKPHDKLYD